MIFPEYLHMSMSHGLKDSFETQISVEYCARRPGDYADNLWEVLHSMRSLRTVAFHGVRLSWEGGLRTGALPRTVEHCLKGDITGTREGEASDTASCLGAIVRSLLEPHRNNCKGMNE